MLAEFPWQLFGRLPVLTAPPEIDTSTSGELRAILSRWLSRGHATVVDLSGTVFCDLAGLRELMRAHQRAEAHDSWLRLVTFAGGAFARICVLTGLDSNIPHFPTVKRALAQPPAAATARCSSEAPG